jgi:hypothetical protein
MGGAYGVPASGIAGNVPTSLGNNTHIDEVLRAADEIQDEDPTVARIRKPRYPSLQVGSGAISFPYYRFGLLSD